MKEFSGEHPHTHYLHSTRYHFAILALLLTCLSVSSSVNYIFKWSSGWVIDISTFPLNTLACISLTRVHCLFTVCFSFEVKFTYSEMYHHKCTFTEFDRKLSFWKEVRQRLWGKRGAGSFLQPFYSACVVVGGEWKLSWVLNWISPSILAYSQHICVCSSIRKSFFGEEW